MTVVNRVAVCACFVALFGLGPQDLSAQTEIRHKVPTFSIEAPVGFERLTKNQLPGTLYSFGKASGAGNLRMTFALQDMGGIFAAKRFKSE